MPACLLYPIHWGQVDLLEPRVAGLSFRVKSVLTKHQMGWEKQSGVHSPSLTYQEQSIQPSCFTPFCLECCRLGTQTEREGSNRHRPIHSSMGRCARTQRGACVELRLGPAVSGVRRSWARLWQWHYCFRKLILCGVVYEWATLTSHYTKGTLNSSLGIPIKK